MSSFVNFLKGLLSGLFSFVGGLLGSKKAKKAELAPAPRKASKSGYYLELEEAKGVGATTPAKALEAAASSVQTTAKTTAKKVASVAQASKPEPAKSEPATPKTPAAPAKVASALNLPGPTVTTFAPDYLAKASSNGRRRPGANMSSFLDMARQVKTSS